MARAKKHTRQVEEVRPYLEGVAQNLLDKLYGANGPAWGTRPTRIEDLLLALRDVDPDKARKLIIELARHYDGKDRFYLEAIGIAVGRDPKRREIILADFDKEFSEWNDHG